MLLVFGSINMDIVVCTKGFPAPGETLLGGQYKVLDGGKGANQAIAAQRTGASKHIWLDVLVMIVMAMMSYTICVFIMLSLLVLAEVTPLRG